MIEVNNKIQIKSIYFINLYFHEDRVHGWIFLVHIIFLSSSLGLSHFVPKACPIVLLHSVSAGGVQANDQTHILRSV